MVVNIMVDSRINATSRIRNLLIEHHRRYPGATLSARDISAILQINTGSVRALLGRLAREGYIRRELVSTDPYRVKWGAKLQ